jgi:hypothetical protein
LEGIARGFVHVPSQNYPGGITKTSKQDSHISGVPTENRTQRLPNTVLELCGFTNVLVVYEFSAAVSPF